MFPPPNSHLPPPSNSVTQGAPPPRGMMMPQKQTEISQVVQQMHGMKVDNAPNNRLPGFYPSSAGCTSQSMESMNYNSIHNLPPPMGTHPAQNINRAASTTKVTYSPQLRATYPYSSQGSIGGNAPPASNSVPSVQTHSSSPGHIPIHNGASESLYTNADNRNGVLNGDFSNAQVMQTHLHPTGTPLPTAKQNSNSKLHSESLTKSNMPVPPNQPGAPSEGSSYGTTAVQSGHMPYSPHGTVSELTAYRSLVSPSSAPYKPPGVPNMPTVFNSVRAPSANTSYNPPGTQSMPLPPYNHQSALNRSVPHSMPGGPGEKIPSTATGIPGGPAPCTSSVAPSGPPPFSSSGIPNRAVPYSPSGVLSGSAMHSPSNIPAGSTHYSPHGTPSGPTPYNLPAAPRGPTSYISHSSPSGPVSYSPPGAHAEPTSYSSHSGPSPYNVPGAPSGLSPYNMPGVPSGPVQHSPLGTPGGPVQHSPLGSPGGPNTYNPHGTPQVPSPLQHAPMEIKLDQLPSAVEFREEDKKTKGGYYPTDTKMIPPPLVTTNFIAQDRGICSPRFMRSTMYCLPNSPDVLKQTGVPFAIVVKPMASICDGENEPPLCIFREEGPLRCKRCKAYMCSFMTFGEGGRCFQCAFCKVVTEVPEDYFCYLDGIGQRTDKFHRPELCLGSYEFIATKDYCKNGEVPNPPAYIFMLEVSKSTLANGMVQLLCENMKDILAALHGDEKNSSARVGFVTYNNVLHFYNLKKSLSQPHIMVMPDVYDAFVPLLDGFLVSITEAEALIDSLMHQIPHMFTNEPSGEVLFGPVVQAGLEALKNANCAGKILIFHSTLPSCDAPGKLQNRDGQKLLGTEKQKTVLTPQNPFYNKLAEECVAAGCCVDLFLFPSAYIDVASMSPLCRHTGGHMYKYMYFKAQVDGSKFLEDLERNVTTETAFDTVLRIRTSAGISPVFYYGNFFMSNATDIEISALNCHKAATIELAYDEKLAENDTVYIQAALLYTTRNGARRIRVHNLSLNTSAAVVDMYRGCEVDAIVNILSKQGVKQVLDQPPQQVKSSLMSKAVKMLLGYKKHCSSKSPLSQLVLPETLKLLPVYVNSMQRSDALAGGSEIALDDRSFAMLALNGMGVENSVFYFYPILISLHDLDLGSSEMPVPVRCSMEKMSTSGAYLLTNGIYMFLWISQGINPEWVQNVFGVQSPSAIEKHQTSLMQLDTPWSKRIRNIIEDLEEMSMWNMRLNIVLQGDKMEGVLRQFLIEDRGVDGSCSYVEFLMNLHREISKVS